jgi:hypothetical protein
MKNSRQRAWEAAETAIRRYQNQVGVHNQFSRPELAVLTYVIRDCIERARRQPKRRRRKKTT